MCDSNKMEHEIGARVVMNLGHNPRFCTVVRKTAKFVVLQEHDSGNWSEHVDAACRRDRFAPAWETKKGAEFKLRRTKRMVAYEPEYDYTVTHTD